MYLRIQTLCLNINWTQVRNVSTPVFNYLVLCSPQKNTALFQCSITSSYSHRRFSVQRRNIFMQALYVLSSLSRYLQINRYCRLHCGAVPTCWDWCVHFVGEKYYYYRVALRYSMFHSLSTRPFTLTATKLERCCFAISFNLLLTSISGFLNNRNTVPRRVLSL